MWVIRHPGDKRPLDDLLAALDEEGSPASLSWSTAIRRDGQPALDRFLGDAATHVRACAALLTTTRCIAAAARYDCDVNGHDWAMAPTEHQRVRMAPSIADIQAKALARQAQAWARIAERRRVGQLAALRNSAQPTSPDRRYQ